MEHKTTQDNTMIDNLYKAILQTQYHYQVCMCLLFSGIACSQVLKTDAQSRLPG